MCCILLKRNILPNSHCRVMYLYIIHKSDFRNGFLGEGTRAWSHVNVSEAVAVDAALVSGCPRVPCPALAA